VLYNNVCAYNEYLRG